MEAVPIISSFITIIRAVADIYKRFKKKEEADALEKAARTIQERKDIPKTEARKILDETLNEELGGKRARSVIRYAEILEVLSPFRFEGQPLEYGFELQRLITQIQNTLTNIRAFKMFGIWLEFPKTGQVITRILPPTAISKCHRVKAMMAESPRSPDCLTFLVVASRAHAKRVRSISQLLFGSFQFVMNREQPYLLHCMGTYNHKDFRYLIPINALIFRRCLESLLQDARLYIEKAARESGESKDLSAKLSLTMQSLKEISSVTQKPQ